MSMGSKKVGWMIWAALLCSGIAAFFSPVIGSGIQTSAYSLIKNAGSALKQRQTINCGTNLTCTDDAGNNWTNIAAAGGGTSFGGINAQTSSYLAVSGDSGKLITMNCSSCTLTLPASPPSATWNIGVLNLNATALTVANNSLTINGAASNITVIQFQTISILTDNANYFTGQTPYTASTNMTFTPSAIGIAESAAGGGGGGGGGIGIVTYSGPSLSLAATQFFPAGGGASASATETNVDVEAPSAVTVGPFYVQIAAALGVGNTTVYTWRKNAADTALTCTITGAAQTTCNDVTHTFTAAQGDLIDIKAVTTGTPAANTVVMATQWGTGGGYSTLQNVGAALTQRTTLNFLNGLGCNDSGTISQCTGYLGVVPPTVASLTWVNQATATTTSLNGVTNMVDSANEEGLHLLCQSETPPYTITINMNWLYQPVSNKFPYTAILAFRDSGSGKIEQINIQSLGSTVPASIAYSVEQWTNATTFSASILAATSVSGSVAGFQVADDGTTNKSWAISIDGSIYTVVKTEARTTFLTANQVCWGIRSNASAAQFEEMTLTGWRVH